MWVIFNSAAGLWRREARYHRVRHTVEEGPEIPGEMSRVSLKYRIDLVSFTNSNPVYCHVSADDLQEERPG